MAYVKGKPTKIAYERYLNDLGFPEGTTGHITHKSNYGAWLKRHDPIMFNAGYHEWEQEQLNKRNGGYVK